MLSFAVIMLNTSLHNPNVRDKPGLERFVAMNRGINEGGDLPEDLLRVSIVPSLTTLCSRVCWCLSCSGCSQWCGHDPHMCLFCSQFSGLALGYFLSSVISENATDFPTIIPSSFFFTLPISAVSLSAHFNAFLPLMISLSLGAFLCLGAWSF